MYIYHSKNKRDAILVFLCFCQMTEKDGAYVPAAGLQTKDDHELDTSLQLNVHEDSEEYAIIQFEDSHEGSPENPEHSDEDYEDHTGVHAPRPEEYLIRDPCFGGTDGGGEEVFRVRDLCIYHSICRHFYFHRHFHC